MYRRTMLKRVGTVGATGAVAATLGAGSVAGSQDDVGNEIRIQTLNQRCYNGDPTAQITTRNGSIDIRGTLRASTPCHEAVVESVSTENGVLEIVLGVESEDGHCVTCIGGIDFAARTKVTDPTLNAVEVYQGGTLLDRTPL